MPEGEERERGVGNLLEEIMTESRPHPVREIPTPAQEVRRVPNKVTSKGPTLRRVVIKMSQGKPGETTLQAVREKQLLSYKGAPRRLSADASAESVQAGRDRQDVVKVMKSGDHPAK